MFNFKPFPHYRQLDSMDCGPTCLRMITKYYGKSYSLTLLREKCYLDKEGVSFRGIYEAAKTIGFDVTAVQIPIETTNPEQPTIEDVNLPAILHWNQNHFVVLYKISKSHYWISDPAAAKKHKLTLKEMKESWASVDNSGLALLLEPNSSFKNIAQTEEEEEGKGLGFLYKYLKQHKRLIIQLIIGLLLGTLFQLIFPLLTQSLIDIGIDLQDLNFIYIVLAAQLMLFFSSVFVRFIQSWILLHISMRINVNLIADFLLKLMNLSIGFFDSKNVGDLLQRVIDHKRIEKFLTESLLSALLAITNIIVFGFVLALYNTTIFLVFSISSILYSIWIFLFLNKRKEVDFQEFVQRSENQDSLIEIIHGMPEIKLQGSQLKRRWKWANIQAKLFKTQIKSLSITQYQDIGASSINQIKDIFITFLAAKFVLDGQLTLGMMLAVQFIISQLNAPMQQLVGFVRAAQDAKISIERLSEIHNAKNEKDSSIKKLKTVPEGDIQINDLSFSYTPISKEILNNINLTIPKGKTTAIIGSSGSGKTTLIKLLLAFYQPSKGSIKIGNQSLFQIEPTALREQCGVVMQDGYIFSDTIANNIAESDDTTDFKRVANAAHVANIIAFIHSLPLGFNTKIGLGGKGLSQGQKQRLFIARAIYKNPDFLFLDEATNALDSTNEKVILKNLEDFLDKKTVVVVAHRLSTVKNADQIIVLDKGNIVERGTHVELVNKCGIYYKLVKNQLELGG